jgi:precorrin-6B methylase 2
MEIGACSGIRALELLRVAPEANYIGFDLFEDLTDELNKQEMNIKKVPRIKTVADEIAKFTLEEVRNAKREKQREFILIQGNTKDTLPAFQTGYIDGFVCGNVSEFLSVKPDFVFIDGGHSVETIQSDLSYVQQIAAEDAAIVMDDFYLPEIPGFGCNTIISGLDHQLFGSKDDVMPFKHPDGSTYDNIKVQMARVA